MCTYLNMKYSHSFKPFFLLLVFSEILLFSFTFRLIEIVTICCKCLMAFSPSLLELLISPDFVPAKWQPLVEIQFNAPKLNVGSTTTQLTFGTILNAAIIFTKALNIVSATIFANGLKTVSKITKIETI